MKNFEIFGANLAAVANMVEGETIAFDSNRWGDPVETVVCHDGDSMVVVTKSFDPQIHNELDTRTVVRLALDKVLGWLKINLQ